MAASASAAYHSRDTAKSQISLILLALGVPEEFAFGTLRLSVGRHTTAEEIDRGAAIIVASAQRQLSKS